MKNGFNSKVEFKGQAYLVQTQDKGPAIPCVESLIYRAGAVLNSKRTFYTPFLGNPDLEAEIERIMTEQHNRILEEIVEGRFV
jgi:hypothetical protein